MPSKGVRSPITVSAFGSLRDHARRITRIRPCCCPAPPPEPLKFEFIKICRAIKRTVCVVYTSYEHIPTCVHLFFWMNNCYKILYPVHARETGTQDYARSAALFVNRTFNSFFRKTVPYSISRILPVPAACLVCEITCTNLVPPSPVAPRPPPQHKTPSNPDSCRSRITRPQTTSIVCRTGRSLWSRSIPWQSCW